jgi:hypothetical protein
MYMEAGAELHQEALLAAGEQRPQAGQSPLPIDPLEAWC